MQLFNHLIQTKMSMKILSQVKKKVSKKNKWATVAIIMLELVKEIKITQ